MKSVCLGRFIPGPESCIARVPKTLAGRGQGQFSTKPSETDMVKMLKTKIKANGPITVSEYMRTILTNPASGYYMHRDVFGPKGDFITAPEISQIFGELLGIWCVHEWINSGQSVKLQVVELGPGRGTLAYDMMRVFSQFPSIKDAISFHLVEVSKKLSEIQRKKLTGHSSWLSSDGSYRNNSTHKQCVSKFNIPIYWYNTITDVPNGFSCFIAHEFFDALPIHKFQKTEKGWREVCIDVDYASAFPNRFKFVLAGVPTPGLMCLQVEDGENRQNIEVCLEGGAMIQRLSQCITEHGGFALLADYGHYGDKTDTFRGFKNHQLHDVLSDPGSADLTADVDFAYLKKMAGNQVSTFGPISQTEFLHNMGIQVRLQVLLQHVDDETKKNLCSSYRMLTDSDKMGERFKFFALLQKRSDNYKPAGFTSLQ